METRNLNETKKRASFKDLIVWQEGHKLVLMIYESSKAFPKDEQFALTSQIRRAIVSVTSNIAEGYGRKHPKDKEHFYIMARGSLDEVANQLQIAVDLGYIGQDRFNALCAQYETTIRLLNGLLRAHKTF